jgi:hypothetical protein
MRFSQQSSTSLTSVLEGKKNVGLLGHEFEIEKLAWIGGVRN